MLGLLWLRDLFVLIRSVQEAWMKYVPGPTRTQGSVSSRVSKLESEGRSTWCDDTDKG